MNFFVQAFLAYLKSHPEVVDRLVEAVVEAIVAHLKNPNPSPNS
jgi:hypothetical protein